MITEQAQKKPERDTKERYTDNKNIKLILSVTTGCNGSIHIRNGSTNIHTGSNITSDTRLNLYSAARPSISMKSRVNCTAIFNNYGLRISASKNSSSLILSWGVKRKASWNKDALFRVYYYNAQTDSGCNRFKRFREVREGPKFNTRSKIQMLTIKQMLNEKGEQRTMLSKGVVS